MQLIGYAKANNGTSYLASVGICNADAKSEEEASLSIKNGGFHIAYEGLQIITTSDKVKVYSTENLEGQ